MLATLWRLTTPIVAPLSSTTRMASSLSSNIGMIVSILDDALTDRAPSGAVPETVTEPMLRTFARGTSFTNSRTYGVAGLETISSGVPT